MKIFRIIFAIIIGALIGLVGAVFWHSNYSGGLQLFPLTTLLAQLIPGIVIGAILGGILYKPVSIIGGLFVGGTLDVDGVEVSGGEGLDIIDSTSESPASDDTCESDK